MNSYEMRQGVSHNEPITNQYLSSSDRWARGCSASHDRAQGRRVAASREPAAGLPAHLGARRSSSDGCRSSVSSFSPPLSLREHLRLKGPELRPRLPPRLGGEAGLARERGE